MSVPATWKAESAPPPTMWAIVTCSGTLAFVFHKYCLFTAATSPDFQSSKHCVSSGEARLVWVGLQSGSYCTSHKAGTQDPCHAERALGPVTEIKAISSSGRGAGQAMWFSSVAREG